MRVGTPAFKGARLVEAREARRLTGIALADSIPLTKSAISAYEKGTATPSPDVFERICDVVNLPQAFFTRADFAKVISTVFYRSMASATKSARIRAERRFGWLTDIIVPYLSDFVSWPAINMPVLHVPVDPLTLFEYEIDDLALDVRNFWGLGERPISNVVWLLENNGILVSRGELETETLDSFSAWVEDRPCIYINSDRSSAVRERYDCAHELGHLLLHRDVVATDYFTHHKEYEAQAHRFAGAFLLPQKAFMREIYTPTLNAFRLSKPKWLTSIGAMIHRAQDLGFIEGEQATNLWRAYARQGWRKFEPLDDKLEFEEPRILSESMRLLISGGHQSPSDIMSAIPLASSDIEDLTGLSRGELSKGPAPIRIIGFHDETAHPRAADILPFRNPNH